MGVARVLVELLALDDLTRRYRSVYPDFTSWEDLLARMLADPVERDTVEGLAAELRVDGSFRKPVMLGRVEDWAADPLDAGKDVLRGVFDAVVGGTHRLCAHVLTGISPVYVEDAPVEGEGDFVGGFPRDEADPRYDWVVSTYLDLPEASLAAAAANVQRVDAGAPVRDVFEFGVWDTLMSLRVNDDVWLSSATGGSQVDAGVVHVSVVWDAEAFLVLPDVITAAVCEKLVRFGFDLTGVRVWTVLEDYAGDQPRVIEDPGAVLPFVPLPRM